MFRPFAHPVTYCCMLLGVVAQSLKLVKILVVANGATTPSNTQQQVTDYWQKIFIKGGKRQSADFWPTVGRQFFGGAVLHFFPTLNNVGSCWPTMTSPFARFFFYNSGFFDNLITSNYCKQVTVRLKAILKIIVKWVAYEIPRNQETRIIIINRKHLQDWAVLQSQFVRWAIGFVAWEPCFVEPSIRDFKSHRNNLSGYRLIGESFTGHHHAVQLYLFLIYPLRVRM